MTNRAFLSAFAAILLSATLVQTAAAYPTTARTATTSVTGSYRPISLDLTLSEGTNALNYTPGGGPFSFEVVFNGRFLGEGYDASGPAGNWRLVLSDGFSDGVFASDDGLIFLTSDLPGRQVGTLIYEGGLIVETGFLPIEDTPILGDEFRLFTTLTGNVLTVNCDTISTCDTFSLRLDQELEHLGPFVDFTFTGGSGSVTVSVLDGSRVNEECVSGVSEEVEGVRYEPCGSLFPLVATGFNRPSAVPEPATLALIGLGLMGFGLSRSRARAQ